MASIIRFAGETDAEYNRRLQPLFAALRPGGMFDREIAKVLENSNAIKDHFRIQELRESCGVKRGRGETFKWKVG